MRLDQETRAQPMQLVALGGPYDGRLIVLRNRWDHAIVETIETTDGLPPLRSASPMSEIRTRRTVYTAVKVAADRNVMIARGAEHYRVLVPSEIATYPEQVNALLAEHSTPSVDGGHRHGKTGRPGDGCTVEDRHEHWCHDCGAVITFGPRICQLCTRVPPCNCGSTDWRSPAPAFPDWIWP